MASPDNRLRISWYKWWRLMRQLRLRGAGIRESGAFLLGSRTVTGGWVTDFVFYDDIDPYALAQGHVHLAGAALNRVWDRCSATGLEVIADVHTHPGSSGQSLSDQNHPMIAIRGHTALIVPCFESARYWHLSSSWRTQMDFFTVSSRRFARAKILKGFIYAAC